MAGQGNLATSNPSLRDYYDKHQLGKILERLVVDLGESRPDDVLKFIEEWASRERSRSGRGQQQHEGSVVLAGTSGSGADAAREAWNAAGAPAGEVAAHFFDVLLTQHASLRRKVFAGVNIDDAKIALAPLLNQAVQGTLKGAALAELASAHGTGRGAEPKHFHYFLTAMLTATTIVIGAEAYKPVAEGFRVLYTRIGDQLQVGLGIRAGDDIQADADIKSLVDQWTALGADGKIEVCRHAIRVLFKQHPTVKQRLFSDMGDDTDGSASRTIAERMVAALDAHFAGQMLDDALTAIGAQYGIGRGAEMRHFHYFLSAGLTALSSAPAIQADFGRTREAWRLKLTHILDLIRIGASGGAGSAASETAETPHTQGQGYLELSASVAAGGAGGIAPAASKSIDHREALVALANRPAFDVVRDSWNMILDKRQLVMRFYAVLLTQHATLCKTVLAEVDLEALAPTLETDLGKLINGEMSTAELKELAQKHGAPRKVQLKHLHYFLSAALTALSITIGDTFVAVAEHWKAVLTNFIEVAASGCCPADGSATPPIHQGSLSLTPEVTTASGGSPGAPADDGNLKERVYSDEECIATTRSSWAGLGAEQRTSVADNFFNILFTQHPTVRRALFADLDEKALSGHLVAVLTAAIDAPSFPSLPAVTALAKEHGSPRQPQTRHYHYFLSAMLAALALAIGRDAYPPVAEPWRRTLTFIGKAAMEGAPPVDAQAASAVAAPAGAAS